MQLSSTPRELHQLEKWKLEPSVPTPRLVSPGHRTPRTHARNPLSPCVNGSTYRQSTVLVGHISQGFHPPDEVTNEFESVPLAKIEDFGAHQNQYYQLDISYFKSACDTALLNSIWNKYTLAPIR